MTRSGFRRTFFEKSSRVKHRWVAAGGFAALIFFNLFVQRSLYAQEETLAKLEEINAKVESSETALQRLSSRQEQLETQLTEIQRALARVTNDQAVAERKIEAGEKEQVQLQSELKGLAERTTALEKISNRRVRAVYMTSNEPLWAHLLYSGKSYDFGKQAFLISRVREFDRRLLRELDETRKAQHARAEDLESSISAEKKLREILEQKRVERRDALAGQQRILDELDQDKQRIKKELLELQAQAVRLEAVVADLTSGSPDRRRVTRQDRPAGTSAPKTKYSGGGLFRAKGQLSFPVEGKVVRGYGRSRVKGFSDYVFNKGLEIESETGAEVLAIYDGMVMYIGKLPGYGALAILDHGERYYSLYGRLGNILVETGQVVERGEKIAEAGTAEENKSNFYFEIRRNGSQINPQQYYKTKFK